MPPTLLTRFPAFSTSNIALLLALFLALGGTAWATATITGAHVVNGSLTGVDVRNGSLTGLDIRTGSVTSSDVGGLRGVDITDGTITGVDVGEGGLSTSDLSSAAYEQLTGRSSATATAAPESLQLGVWNVDGYEEALAQDHRTAVSYHVPLSIAPPVGNMHYINYGDTTPVGCTGDYATPGASPGHLCAFELSTTNLSVNPTYAPRLWSIAGAPGDDVGPNRLGFAVMVYDSGGGPFSATGTWAYRAPEAS